MVVVTENTSNQRGRRQKWWAVSQSWAHGVENMRTYGLHEEQTAFHPLLRSLEQFRNFPFSPENFEKKCRKKTIKAIKRCLFWEQRLGGGVYSQRRSRFERATRSLAMFVRSHRSLAPQRSALLRLLRSLTLFTGSFTHHALSPVGQLKFLNMCSIKQTHFLFSQETHPKFMNLMVVSLSWISQSVRFNFSTNGQ